VSPLIAVEGVEQPAIEHPLEHSPRWWGLLSRVAADGGRSILIATQRPPERWATTSTEVVTRGPASAAWSGSRSLAGVQRWLRRGEVGELLGNRIDSGTFADGALDAGSSAPPQQVRQERELLQAAQLASGGLEARERVLQDLADWAQGAVGVGKPAVDAEAGGLEAALFDELGGRFDARLGLGRFEREALHERDEGGGVRE
jgi:hypothetical protein